MLIIDQKLREIWGLGPMERLITDQDFSTLWALINLMDMLKYDQQY